MSVTISALIVTLVGALASAANLVGPPPLPPEPEPAQDPGAQEEPPATEGESDAQPGETVESGETRPEGSELPPAPVRSSLPPGLQPVPFPLENSRTVAPPLTGEGSSAPAAERRSIVDLRDPFNRPPPRPRAEGPRDASARLLMPDLKDPFAPGIRRVRSKTLEQRVPNDIRDPFRSPRPAAGRSVCTKTTADGTVVQAPGKQTLPRKDCQPSRIELRDPFDRGPNR